MNKGKYPYSPELKEPFSFGNLNFETGIGAVGLKLYIAKTKKEVKSYRPKDSVSIKKEYYPAKDGKMLEFYVVEPKGYEGKLPTVIYYHGGGFIFPLQPMMFENATYYAQNMPCRVLLPEYRIAPEVSCQTILEDCYAMLLYAKENASKLQLDKEKIIVYGDSAGGALAAGVTLLARDRKGPEIAGQMLIYPVIDSQSELYESVEKYKDAVWSKCANQQMWRIYLKQADQEMLKYIVPIRNHLEGLPDTYVEGAQIDILCDEGRAYADKLNHSGVHVLYKMIPGAYHGYDADQDSPLVKKVLRDRVEIMQQFFFS